ncbi:MAG TPA: PAS domain S-box protein [Devosia sp.]|nr:PAS domain S-box protein [Devosia sp.]
MDNSWIKSPEARRVLEHWTDARPAWLWSADGQKLIWRNPAARFLTRKQRKRETAVVAGEAVPLRGQVQRLIRLGVANHASLSRMQFLVDERPVSATCACTPLALEGGETGLLVVDVDAIPAEFAATLPAHDPMAETLLPVGADYLLVSGGKVAGGSPRALELYAGRAAGGALPGDGGRFEQDGQQLELLRLRAGPGAAELLVFLPAGAAAADNAAPAPPPAVPEIAPPLVEPMLPMGLAPIAPAPPAPPRREEDEPWVEPMKPSPNGGLTSLFDRLANDGALFGPLGPADDQPPPGTDEQVPAQMPPVAAEPGREPEPEPESKQEPEQEAPALYRVIGRGFAPGEAANGGAEAVPPPEDSALIGTVATPAEPSGATAEEMPPVQADAESVERVSRYNFDELSRILNDRIGNGNGEPRAGAPGLPVTPPKEGALVTLGGETLVLNRLPLGILVFRDQQVLFANRAITEMTGYESVEALRQAGLGAIFPAISDEAPEAGPVNHLVQRDGALVPVTARLQSVSWRGKPALMLSASATEVRTGHEAAVRAFAEHLASARADGFIETARSGVLTHISADARMILGQEESQLLGRPVSTLAAPEDADELRAFFERPARFAETTRPSITFKGRDARTEIMLFAQGQAGIISSYFGFLRRTDTAPLVLPPPAPAGELDPGLLERLSRGVRRPLNTVIGFSDLIGSSAFGEIENQRYVEYARDIKTAGLEIAALVDELDDFSRLRDGRYLPRPTDLDLSALLDSAVLRVRGLANRARVLVRSAISERLPHVFADRTSLAQAILNLLASAVDQTPQDGSVVLAAQLDEDGNVVVKIRDSAQNVVDLGERFVVFRDGVGRDGEPLTPVRSSVGLALTRALLSVNGASLAVDPAGTTGTLFSLTIPAGKAVGMKELPAGPAE